MRLLTAIFWVLLASPAFAQPGPKDLQQIESDLQAGQTAEKALADKKAALQQDVDETQNRLVDLANDIRRSEKAILDLKKQQATTQNSIDLVKARLDDQRQSLAQVILALQRLSRMPPQALLLRPSAPIDAARTHDLLQDVLPGLMAQANEVKASLAELDKLYHDQQQQEKNRIDDQKSLDLKQQNLADVLSQRKNTLKDNDAQLQQAAAKSAELAAKAKDLRDLLDRIAREAPPPKKTGLLGGLKKIFQSDTKNLSNMPATGQITLHFGETLPGGGESQGIRISAAPGVVVVAPASGAVRFAGPFRQYKLLTIIQQDNGDMILLGGMQDLYTKSGMHLKTGEPVGRLPGDKKIGDDTGAETSLYYEKRRHGKPIDPLQAGG